MIKRYGGSVLNSDTAYCFGGNGVERLHITRRSKQYFIYNKSKDEIIPIEKKAANEFAELNNFDLVKKDCLSIRVSFTYKNYQKVLNACNGNNEKVKDFVKTAINEKMKREQNSCN